MGQYFASTLRIVPYSHFQFGLGSMGIGMSENLQTCLGRQGLPPLRFSNRSLDKGKSLEALGAESVADFPSLVQQSDIIFTMISNDEVLHSLVDEALAVGDLEHKIFVDTSTVHPETSKKVAAKLAEKKAIFVASPVFGASQMAASGQLIFAMAGPSQAIEKIRPYVIGVMAKQIIDCGEDVSRSSLLKITGNIMVIGLQELISEVQVFAEKTGLGTETAEEFIGSMFGPVLSSYSKRLTSGSYAPPHDKSPGFAVSLSIKDSKHALSIASEAGMRVPAIELALSHMLNARNYAGENLDSSSVYGTLRVEGGLPFWSANSRQGI
ncbi:NAD(P)-binding protein [Aureobasidium pullulans]|nr:NAD(P)-binding protein [Aureobasidium pullulans]